MSDQPLRVGPIAFEGHENYLYRDSIISSQLLITSPTGHHLHPRPIRIIAAFPKGNTGALLFFSPSASASSATSNIYLSSPITSISYPTLPTSTPQIGISFSITLTNAYILDTASAVLGSIRAIRDVCEGEGLHTELQKKLLCNHHVESSTGIEGGKDRVSIKRVWIDQKTTQFARFQVVNNLKISHQPTNAEEEIAGVSEEMLQPKIKFDLIDPSIPGTLIVSISFNYSSPWDPTSQALSSAPSPPNLFITNLPSSSSPGLSTILSALLNTSTGEPKQKVSELSFLAAADKWMAGGWRFLTYFGRDTLITSRLMMPILSSEAIESILSGVIERIASDGAICHEENIGDYASFQHILEGHPEKGDEPIFDYSMVDTDFLLLPSLSHYLLSIPQGMGRGESFLSREAKLQESTYRELLDKNVQKVLQMAKPFVMARKRGERGIQELVKIRHDFVGNWRDSYPGLGWSKIAYDVNVAFVPAALRAIESLAHASLISSAYAMEAMSFAEVWELDAVKAFEVSLSQEKAEQRIQNYITEVGLEGSPVVIREDLKYHALGLNEDGSAVEVIHCDLGATLLYASNISEETVRAVVQLLRPYPQGLITNVGMVIANAAFSSRHADIKTFSNAAYHGAVVWSWQQALMAAGISRVLSLCKENPNRTDYPLISDKRPAWAQDESLVAELEAAEKSLWESIKGAAEVMYTEVWSPIFEKQTGRFRIGDLGALSLEGTEADAVQLWSYAFLAAIDPNSGEPVANDA